jgi:hypothetical protein
MRMESAFRRDYIMVANDVVSIEKTKSRTV